MNETKKITPGGDGRGEYWLDRFLPENGEPGGDRRVLTLPVIRGFIHRQRNLMLATLCIVMLLAVVLTLLMTPLYKATSTVRVEPYGNNIVEGQDLAPTIPTNEIGRYFFTLGNVVESRSMAYRVVDSLNLDERASFLGENYISGKPDDVAEREWARQKRETAADILRANVTAVVPFDTRIMSIEFESGDPVLAAEIANAYADNFVLDDTLRSLEANSYAQEYLQEQIADVRVKLQEAELKANAYARRAGIVKPLATGSLDEGAAEAATITATNLVAINQTYTEARAKRISAEQRWRAVANLPASQLPDVQQNLVVQTLVEQRSLKAAELADMQQRYDENYPAVLEAKAQLAELDQQIARSSNEIKASIRNDYEIARRQEAALASERQSVAGATLAEQDKRVQYDLLDREARALRGQLASLLSRYNEISTAANVKEGSITKLDAATIPSYPVSPNFFRNMLAALVVGLALAGGLALLREIFDDRLRTLEEIEDRLGLPLLGHTPYIEEDELELERGNPFSALSEAYASIVSSLDHSLPRDTQVLQFTSSQASEGKSTTAMIVAQQYAALGRKVLLVDGDLRRPHLAKMFGANKPEAGLAEVLLGEAEIGDALLKNTGKNLDVLPSGKSPANPVELMSSSALEALIEEQSENYDKIVIDSSPVMGIADAPLLSRHVDATLFVIEANHIQYAQAKAAIRRLRHVGANIPGVVMTKYKALMAGQYYGYEYRYYTYSQEVPA